MEKWAHSLCILCFPTPSDWKSKCVGVKYSWSSTSLQTQQQSTLNKKALTQIRPNNSKQTSRDVTEVVTLDLPSNLLDQFRSHTAIWRALKLYQQALSQDAQYRYWHMFWPPWFRINTESDKGHPSSCTSSVYPNEIVTETVKQNPQVEDQHSSDWHLQEPSSWKFLKSKHQI